MTNILEAIYNIAQQDGFLIKEDNSGSNRINNMGTGLETFVKDCFANTFQEDEKSKNEIHDKLFSHKGSKNKPPDFMIREGAAVEVKKVESVSANLQLNSSYPKQILKVTNTNISKECRKCEEWDEKDFIYTVGHIPKSKKSISSLWFIYGNIYAASESYYMSLINEIQKNIRKTKSIFFGDTKELASIKEVDPMNNTVLRVRGMWRLASPYKVFDYLHGYDESKAFQCFLIIPTDKFDLLPEKSRSKIASLSSIIITDEKVKDPNAPNNPAKLIDCKLIKYVV